jgi:hypothetical protein
MSPRALLPLALVAVIVAARPVTAVADHGSRHDQCEAAAGTWYESGSGYGCPVPAAAAAQPAPSPLPTSPAPAATAPPAPALPVPRPATRPDLPSAGADPRSSLVGGAALAGLALLVMWGFRARRRLRQGWDEGASDPG